MLVGTPRLHDACSAWLIIHADMHHYFKVFQELEFSPDFLGRKGGAFYAPVHLIHKKTVLKMYSFFSMYAPFSS
jgi:hypothetical protein